MIEDIVIDEEIESLRPSALPRYMFNFRNPGFAVDVGVNYRPIDQLLLSASAVDIGFISWKDEVHDATLAMEYEHIGFELDPQWEEFYFKKAMKNKPALDNFW